MSTISRFVTLFPALILVFLVGCSTLTPYEKEERAVEKKAPPKVILPAETKEKAEREKDLKEESADIRGHDQPGLAGFSP